jgi:hypothetical protein
MQNKTKSLIFNVSKLALPLGGLRHYCGGRERVKLERSRREARRKS